jgi:alpha-L-arabinofuranosidase
MTFDIFNRHAEKIEMANVAQTINCLHSLFAAVGDKYARTPAYYAFEMYRPHMGGKLVPVRIDLPEMPIPILEGSARLPRLSGSASIRDKSLTVTLTNPSLQESVATRIRVSGGARLREARATVLTHEDMRAANTFERPDEVGLAALAAQVSGDTATLTIPAPAVVAISLQLV